jgi:hypothetical protein
MHKADLREQTRKAAEKRKKKMGTRLSKGEKKNCKRMATVAAVYTIDPLYRAPEDLIAEEGGGKNRRLDRVPSKSACGQASRKSLNKSLQMRLMRPIAEIQIMKNTGSHW